ncbi:hypothetical protein DH2020_040723 [Rehmannia glutinosa]|uniref:BHLH domain-containing protein n=1 Tax=Rehmannia glutinosa TaxID=99300 RepID=A0ABR0UUB8_REHGL
MLRFAQSPSSSSSSSVNNQMDLSVLDRKRAVLQRLYRNQLENEHLELHSLIDRQQQLVSSVTGVPNIPKPDWQCNSNLAGNVSCSSSPKKRKAEFFWLKLQFDVEEAGEEKSEITTTKTERENSANTCSKVSEVQKPDYIHVRARRGQATDSHSLAERARREKISKKMKCLQDLVPGCNKVTGKAGMLDEIINYVQSLQKQVEFLSMKLAHVNPRLDFSIDNIFAKDIPVYIANLPQFEASNSTCFQYNTMQQGTSSNCGADIAIDQSQMLSQKTGPTTEAFLDSSFISQLQQLSGWESDWPNLFN